MSPISPSYLVVLITSKRGKLISAGTLANSGGLLCCFNLLKVVVASDFGNYQHQRLLIPSLLFWSIPCYLWSSPLHLWSLPCYLWSPPPHLWTSQPAPTVVANYFSSQTFLHQRSLQIFQLKQLVEHITSCCKLSQGSSSITNPQLNTDLISAHCRSDLCPG